MGLLAFTVKPNIPAPLAPLEELARNLWISWNYEAILLFMRLDYDAWLASRQSPTRMLGLVPQKRLDEAAADDSFLSALSVVHAKFRQYLAAERWYKGPADRTVAYFSMRVRDRRGAPDLLRGARSPLGRPPEVGFRPRDPARRRRAPVPEGIFPPGPVAGRVAEGAVPGQRLVQHAGDDGDAADGRALEIEVNVGGETVERAGLAGGRRPHSPVPARHQHQGKLRALPGDHLDPLRRRPGHAHPAGDPARRRRRAGAEGPRHPADRVPHERGALRVPRSSNGSAT